MRPRSALPYLLAAGVVIFTARYQKFDEGDKRDWAWNIPTGTEGSRCMGMTRSQYVPFWCLTGALCVTFYAALAFRQALARRSARQWLEWLSRLMAGATLGRLREEGKGRACAAGMMDLEASLLEAAQSPLAAGSAPAAHAATLVPAQLMERVCSACAATKGLEAASLAVFLVLKHRRSYGSATVAAVPAEGSARMVIVDLKLPHMSFAELLAAADAALTRAPELAAEDVPDCTLVWGQELPAGQGQWLMQPVAAGQLQVRGPAEAADAGEEERQFRSLFEACAAAPEGNIWEMPMLSELEAQQLRAWGSPPKDFSSYRGSAGKLRTFPEVFAEQRAPGSAAAVAGVGFSVSYADLRRRVAAVAQAVQSAALETAGVTKGWSLAVVVYMGRGEAVAAAFLGILQAGYTAVPIDVHWPAERARSVVVDSSAALALVAPATQDAWVALQGMPKFMVICDALYKEHSSSLSVMDGMDADKPAITLFTSGSTGKPKGIVLSHGYVMVLALGRAESLRMSETTRTLLHQSPTWMPFIDYLFGPLLTGGCCVFVPEQTGTHAVTPSVLRALAREHQATILGFVPPVLDIFLDEDLPAMLRCICVGGAAVAADLCARTVAAFNKQEPGAQGFLATGYHGTEQGDVSQIQVGTLSDIDRYASARGLMTSGRPHTTQRFAILDQGLSMVAPGGVGEITVAGPGLATGYLGLPEKTAETFLQCEALGSERAMRTSDLGRWTPQGSLEVVGRRDTMVKVRGARVELGEVEAAVASHPQVRACVVVVHQDRLVAYVVPAVPSDLRDLCKQRLASYMVPHVFEGLDALPQLANGKVNKKALPPPSEAAGDGSETVIELDSLGQMRKLTRTSATEDRILDNVRAILMIIVIQSHATPLVTGSLAMQDVAHVQIDADWSYTAYALLTMSRSGGWSALAYMAGFDDTRGDSAYRITYREALFLGLWGLSGFKWTMWFLPAFVYMRILFVIAHKCRVMVPHMLIAAQLWLTVPMFVDWYVGWRPAPPGQQQQCSAHCFCPFQGRLWVESAAYYGVGMWTVGEGMISHSFVGRGLFFVPCYWLGFYSGRRLFRVLGRLSDETSWRSRMVIAATAGAVYYSFFTWGSFIEGGFDDRCSSFWAGDHFVWQQVLKNVGFYMENLFTSLLYVIVVVAIVPVHLKRLAKTCFAAYILAAFAPFFCLLDLPSMAVEIRKAVDPTLVPLAETVFVFAQPTLYVLVVGSLGMWCVQVAVQAVIAIT